MRSRFARFIGDKAFYKSVLTLLIPMLIQQFITSFVSLLENVMVGSLGKEAISAASIANQVMMVFALAVFGGLSGASIFGAQFYGKGDMDGMRHTFRVKMYFGVLVSAAAILIYLFFGEDFIRSFLQGESNGGDMALTLKSGCNYLYIMLWGLPPFALVQVYAGTLRESGETRAPMFAGICAILTNLAGNWILIFGNLGAPQMGVEGAAIATVVSRYAELAIVVVYAHRHTEKYIFLQGAYKSLHVPRKLVRRLNAVAALNITGTVWNLFCVIMFAMGNAVSIMVGQRLGAGKMKEARDVDGKLIFLTEVIHVIIGAVMIICSPLLPRIYNVGTDVQDLTRQLLIIAGLSLPLHSFAHVTYFTIRSGGRTVITFFFDAVYTWLVTVVLAFILTRLTDWDIVRIYLCVQFIDIVKVFIGLLMLKSDFWARNVVND